MSLLPRNSPPDVRWSTCDRDLFMPRWIYGAPINCTYLLRAQRRFGDSHRDAELRAHFSKRSPGKRSATRTSCALIPACRSALMRAIPKVAEMSHWGRSEEIGARSERRE